MATAVKGPLYTGAIAVQTGQPRGSQTEADAPRESHINVPRASQGYDMDASRSSIGGPQSLNVNEPMLSSPPSAVPGVDLDMRPARPIKDWSDGIFDCSVDTSSAVLSFLLQPLRFALTAERAKLSNFYNALAWMSAFWILTIVLEILSLVLPASVDYIFQYAAWVTVMGAILMGTVHRLRLRSKYGIHGNGCEDCLYHGFLSCCAVAQEARHVDRSVGILTV